MGWIESIVLGIVQGVTEILPVSSDGHLAVLQYLWNVPEDVRINLTAALHLGTALALLVFFSGRVKEIIVGAFARDRKQRNESRSLIRLLIVASLPAVIAGLLLDNFVEGLFTRPTVIGTLFILNGAVLFFTRFARVREVPLNWWRALLVGLAQSAAILPAISRSGMTISMALFLGMAGYQAFEFSFLLALPITLGAALFELLRLDFSVLAPGPVVGGILTAGCVGFLMILSLRQLVVRRRFFLFAGYCVLLGVLILIFLG